jgi:hypothetical protein
MPALRRPGANPTTTNGVLSYEIDWGSMQVGESFFIPTHDPVSIRSQLYWQGRKFGYNLVFREMFYRGFYGLMTWRGNDVLEPQSD